MTELIMVSRKFSYFSFHDKTEGLLYRIRTLKTLEKLIQRRQVIQLFQIRKQEEKVVVIKLMLQFRPFATASIPPYFRMFLSINLI